MTRMKFCKLSKPLNGWSIYCNWLVFMYESNKLVGWIRLPFNKRIWFRRSNHLYFSERNGYRKYKKIGPFIFGIENIAVSKD